MQHCFLNSSATQLSSDVSLFNKLPVMAEGYTKCLFISFTTRQNIVKSTLNSYVCISVNNDTMKIQEEI